jgi:hypothetical protein
VKKKDYNHFVSLSSKYNIKPAGGWWLSKKSKKFSKFVCTVQNKTDQ